MTDHRSNNRRRGIITFWVPVLTVSALALGGIATWVASTRADHAEGTSDDEDEHLSYGDHEVDKNALPSSRPTSYGVSEGLGPGGPGARPEDAGVLGRVQNVIRRTPSPQQMLDGARKGVVAGVAAVGGMMGGGLSSIREDGEDRPHGGFEDHERWRQDGSAGPPRGAIPGGKRRTVAIVISAEEGDLHPIDEEDAWKTENTVSKFTNRVKCLY
jgi:hypothetical protein